MKRTFFLWTFIMLLFPVNMFAAHYQDLPNITSARIGLVQISQRTLEAERIMAVVVNGYVPEVVGSDTLSAKVEDIIENKLGNGPGTVYLSYKIVQSDGFLSIIFHSEVVTLGGSRSERVQTLTIERATLNEISASDILGDNGLRIATDVVNQFIVQNFRNMPRIPALTDDTRFYVTNEAVYFIFDRYEIAPGSEGIQSVPVYFSGFERYFLGEGDYQISEGNHGVRMLPLRRIAEHFDYVVSWDSETLEISLRRINGNGNGYITLTLNLNSYRRINDLTARTLEAAPEIIGGATYVPISFFDLILDIHYSISTDGTIELTTYRN